MGDKTEPQAICKRRSKDQKMQVHRREGRCSGHCVENLLAWTRERLGDGRVDVQRKQSHSPSTKPNKDVALTSGLITRNSLQTAAGYSCDQKKVAFGYFVIFFALFALLE